MTNQPVHKTEEEWKKELTPEQYEILRGKGTERPFTGEYVDSHEEGMFVCAACGNVLFASDAKFDSGTGWPSFDRPAVSGAVEQTADASHGMARTEVMCNRCGGHLGHVFNDGPTETCQRFCINSAALKLKKKE